MRAIWPLMLAGCGRLGFDATVDATADGLGDARPDVELAGHDEDGDGVDDAIDGCPHLADPAQIDSDGDRVDDLCDPNPAQPRDHIAWFDPFITQRPEWTFMGAPVTYSGDSLQVDTRTVELFASIAVAPALDVFVIGGRFGASGAALNRQLAIAALDVNAYYYCELFDSGGAPHFALSYTPDNVSFFELAQSPAQLPFANGDVSLTLRHRPPTFEGVTTWPVTAQTLSQPIPTGITPTRIGIAVQGIDARFDYFLQIHTDP